MSKSEKKRVIGKKSVSKNTKIKFGKRLKANYLVLNKLTTEQIKLWVKYQAKPVISRFKNGINGLANAIHLWNVRRNHKLPITQDWMRINQIPEPMLELLFNLPDDQLAEIIVDCPEIMSSICIGLSLELYERERFKNISNRRELHW